MAETLDYEIGSGHDVTIGSVVQVPLKGRRVRGWVIDLFDDDSSRAWPGDRKPIICVSSDIAIASPATVSLARWAGAHYAGAAATVLSWATPKPLPHSVRTASRVETKPIKVGEISDYIRSQRRIETFVRTWPGDDATATVAALLSAVPDDRSALIVTPRQRKPSVAGGIEQFAETDRDRTIAWEHAIGGTAPVVAGRRGPFIPIPNLGLVIVTQEHSDTHKDERTPALDARTIARRLAADQAIPYVAIGPMSAIGPEGVIASQIACGQEPTELVVPGTRGHWPLMEMIDMRDPDAGSASLSDRFFGAVRSTAAAGGRTLVFLNRKGTARALVCRRCDELATCRDCGALLRPSGQRLVCEHCGFELDTQTCPTCGAGSIRRVGIGVDGLRNELDKAFPNTVVHVSSNNDVVECGRGEIVVGTRLALRRAGYFDVVILIDPDGLLGRLGIRSEEMAFALLIDAVGAAKPATAGGRVIVQTRRPDTAAMRALARRDASIFEQDTLERRRRQRLPPFRGLLEVESTDHDAVDDVCQALRAAGAEVLGPEHKRSARAIAFVDNSRWIATMRNAREAALAHGNSRVRLVADPLDI